jgi:hypothetical protein
MKQMMLYLQPILQSGNEFFCGSKSLNDPWLIGDASTVELIDFSQIHEASRQELLA